MVELPQTALWCPCGRSQINSRGICSICDRRRRLSRENFGGLRDRVLLRDGRAQCCGEVDDLLVHHRRPGRNDLRLMLSMCRPCHARIHHTLRPAYSFPEHLRELWREVHPDLAEQLLLPLSSGGVVSMQDALQPALFETA